VTFTGDVATALKLNVADQAAINQLVIDEEAQGGIDIFVSNAGYAKGGGLSLEAFDWQQMMDVHMWPHMWLHLYAAQAVIPKMIERGVGVSVLCPQAVRTKILGKSSKSAKKPESNQAANDGILEPDSVADCCLKAIENEEFLVLPHPEVAKYFRNKANDYERWLNGMRKFRNRLFKAKKMDIGGT